MKRERPMNWLERLVKSQAAASGLTQSEVARSMGVTPQTLQNRLSRANVKGLGMDYLTKLANALKCDPMALAEEVQRHVNG